MIKLQVVPAKWWVRPVCWVAALNLALLGLGVDQVTKAKQDLADEKALVVREHKELVQEMKRAIVIYDRPLIKCLLLQRDTAFNEGVFTRLCSEMEVALNTGDTWTRRQVESPSSTARSSASTTPSTQSSKTPR